MGCVLPSKRKKILIAIPTLKASLLDKKNNRTSRDSSLHGEVHFGEEVIRQSILKENKDLNCSNPGHNSNDQKDMKETLKRTNTPNFRKTVNYEPKLLEDESSKNQMDQSQKSDQGESHTKPLMKSPTFSRNITNQTNNKKPQHKQNLLVDENENAAKKIEETATNIESNKDIENVIKMEKANMNNVGQQSPIRTRFYQGGKQKEKDTSPHNLINNKHKETIENFSSQNSNLDMRSPSHQVSSNVKMDLKNSSSPSNLQKFSESNDSHKSLEKVCEEDNSQSSLEKKNSKKINNAGSYKRVSPKNIENNKESRFTNNTTNNNVFKTNLIDFFRNEEKTSSNNGSNNNVAHNSHAAPIMTASSFKKNSKNTNPISNKMSQQSIVSNNEVKNYPSNPISNKFSQQSIVSTHDIKTFQLENQEQQTKPGFASRFFHINPNANLISMFKNETETQNLNLGEDDNHNFVTIDDDGPSPINRPPFLHNENGLEPERETSLNISTFENVCSNDVTNSNIEKSEINRTTLNNVDDISKDLSKYSINADYLNVEYDDKKGQRDHSPSNNGNILSGLNSPINNNHQGISNSNPHTKPLAFSAMKSSNKQHKAQANNQEENKFLSPTIVKKSRAMTTTPDKFKLRSLTMKEIDDSREEKGQNVENNDANNVSSNNIMTNSVCQPQSKKLEPSNNNRLDVSQRMMPRSPTTLVSGRLQRAKTTLEAENSVVHTSKLDITKDEQGNKKINNYLMIKDLGKGGFGKVKLALNETDKKNYAIKIANKKKLKRKLLGRTTSVYTLLEKEVATMKKLDHPNIVRLYEVIDDAAADKLYLVMEFMKKGAILSKSYFKYEEKNLQEDLNFDAMMQKQELQEKKSLTYDKAQKYFRDFLLGLDYLHTYANVIHRDLKPENLLVDENDVLKIADFGVSTIMENGDDQLSNNAGTKAFLAPETWDGKPFKGKKADVWAAAATLYFLVVGKLPFHAGNAEDLKKKIQEDKPEFPSDMPPGLQDLISKGLEKNPEKRITVPMMMNHPWVTDNGLNQLENFLEEEEFEISEREIKNAMTKISFRATIMLTYKLKQSLNRTRSRIMQRKASNASNYSQISEIG